MTASAETPERELHREIAAILALNCITYGHARFGVLCHYTPGWPDFTFAINGQAWGVEVKTSSGKLDPKQVRILARLREEGWRIAVVRSVEEVRALLSGVQSRQASGADGLRQNSVPRKARGARSAPAPIAD